MGMIIVRRWLGVLALNTVVVRKAGAFFNLNIISVIRQCCLLLHPATIRNVADDNPFVFLPFCTLFMLNQAKMSGGTGGGGGGGDGDSVVLQRYN